MDQIDQNLLQNLQEDGRQRYKALAKKLGLSQATVQWRIKNLVNEGVVKFTTQVNPNIFSSPIGILVGVYVTQKEFNSVKKKLLNHPNTAMVFQTIGRFNIFTLALFSNFEAVSDFILNTGEGMTGIKRAEVFPLIHLNRMTSPLMNLAVDSLDRKLIELLSVNGRESSVALAKSLKTNPTTIQRRMHNLLQERVIRIFAAVDDTKTDWYWPAIVGIKVDHMNLHTVIEKMREIPRVRLVSPTFGSYTVIGLFDGQSKNEVIEFAEENISRMQGVTETELFISEGVIYCPIKVGD